MAHNNDIRSLLHNFRNSDVLSKSFFDALWFAFYVDQRTPDFIIDYNPKEDGLLGIEVKKVNYSDVVNVSLLVTNQNNDLLLAAYKISLGINIDVECIHKEKNVSLQVFDMLDSFTNRKSYYLLNISVCVPEVIFQIPNSAPYSVLLRKDSLLDYPCKVYLIVHYSDAPATNVEKNTYINIKKKYTFDSHLVFYTMLSRYLVYKDEMTIALKPAQEPNPVPGQKIILHPLILLEKGNLLTGGSFLFLQNLYQNLSGGRPLDLHKVTCPFKVRNYFNRVITEYKKEYPIPLNNVSPVIKQRTVYDLDGAGQAQIFIGNIPGLRGITPILGGTGAGYLNLQLNLYLQSNIQEDQKNIFRGIGYFDLQIAGNGNDFLKIVSTEIKGSHRKNIQDGLIYHTEILLNTLFLSISMYPDSLRLLNNNIESIKIFYHVTNAVNATITPPGLVIDDRMFYNEFYPMIIKENTTVAGVAVEEQA